MKKRIWLWLLNLITKQLLLMRRYVEANYSRSYIIEDEQECLALAATAEHTILNDPFDDMIEHPEMQETKVMRLKQETTEVIKRNGNGDTRIIHDWSRDMGQTIVEDWSHLFRK